MSRTTDNRQNRNMSSHLPDDAEQPPLELDEQSVALIRGIYANASSFADMHEFVHGFVELFDKKTFDILTNDDSSENLIIECADGTEIYLPYSDLAIARHFLGNYIHSIYYMGASVTQHVESKINPPIRAQMLLHFGLPTRDREYMIGDLEEEFRGVILPKYGPRVAMRWYWWQAVRSVVVASGGRVRIWLSFGGLARAAGWIVEKFTL